MATVPVFGEVITALMSRYGFTSKTVAERAHISHSTVRNITSGYRHTVEEDTARAIARALNVSVSAIAAVDSHTRRTVS